MADDSDVPILRHWLLGLLLAFPFLATRGGEGRTFQVGVAKIDVTPEHPIRLTGFAVRKTESEGVEQHLWAKALALGADSDPPAVLITVDNCGVCANVTDEVAARLKAKAGLARERLSVCSSHTHAGPCTVGFAPNIFALPIPAEQQARINRYTRELTDRLERVALAALADRKAARLSWGEGTATFARNRRTTNGPTDLALPILAVTDTNGVLRAVLANYACHCTTVGGGFNRTCGDWAGFAQAGIEQDHPGVVALISIGCGADANPHPRGGSDHGLALARQHGGELAAEVKRLIDHGLKPIDRRLECRAKRIELPFEKLPTREQWIERARQDGIVGYHARRNLERLDRGESLPTTLPYYIQAWNFGEQLAMVFLPGEVVVDYSLRLKQNFDPRRLWVTAYANDVPCYIPSRRILSEGGYEAETSLWYYDRPARLSPAIEDLIVATVADLMPSGFRAGSDRAEVSPANPTDKAVATLPETETAKPDPAKMDHWAFKPAVQPPVPQVHDPAWPRNPIDNFILARLEAEKLSPAPEADRRTLIRRLSFDLTGLPPAPDQVDQFLSDQGNRAYENLVDRLLDSPRYGERWARHWLDVVHYGDSHGYDKDKPRLNAWPYRDYVIRSFNGDKSYSRFVQEQLAGDVLFPDTADGVIATGFIAAGPWDFVGHVELPESKTDGLIARYNDRDDMVMTAMSTFQSLTVHCARCHDHKFDPISQKEYYRLQSVFAGVDRANRTFDNDPEVAARRRSLTSGRKVLEKQRQELAKTVAGVTSPEIARADVRLQELRQQLKALPVPVKESPANGYHSQIASEPDATKWVQIDLGKPVVIDEIRLTPARPTDFPDTPGFGFPKRFKVEISDDPQFVIRQPVAEFVDHDHPNPGDNALSISTRTNRARYVRVTASRLWERTRDYVFALAELQVWSGTNNVAPGASVSALDSIEAGRWGTARLVDNFDSRKSLIDTQETAEILVKRQALDSEVQKLTGERESLVQTLTDPQTRRDLLETDRQLARLKADLGKLPEPEQVFAAATDFKAEGNFAPAPVPRPVHLLRRGEVKRPGALMSPGSLSCVPGLTGEFDAGTLENEGARRAAMAKWITDPGNMLTRRSLVNRVWQYHFGRGIVETPNDFGHMGSLPTHPELLDWLAFWFVNEGESLKKLHRLLVTSATYRQSSACKQAGAESRDGDNRYLWRMNRQRLDAESFRDALLSVSGRLDLTMGGPSVQQFFFKDDHSPVYDYTRYDVDSPGSCRRSIYRFVVRSVPDPFMECLDSADPSLLTARRNVTMTALQTLATLNNPLVIRQCEHFAERLQQTNPMLDAQIDQAYRLCLNRRPTAAESRSLTEYASRYGLPNACRLLINSNEFMFID